MILFFADGWTGDPGMLLVPLLIFLGMAALVFLVLPFALLRRAGWTPLNAALMSLLVGSVCATLGIWWLTL